MQAASTRTCPWCALLAIKPALLQDHSLLLLCQLRQRLRALGARVELHDEGRVGYMGHKAPLLLLHRALVNKVPVCGWEAGVIAALLLSQVSVG